MWLTFSQTTAAVIDGFEAAWRFFGGVFGVVIPDNLTAMVDRANPIDPRLNQAFVEYAQARGFMVDAARVRHPQDKPRVERKVPYVRRSFFAGETFVDLADAQRRAEEWCCSTGRAADPRHHGLPAGRALRRRGVAPAVAGAAERYDLPLYASPKVHRDHHIEVAKALYSMPGGLIGQRVDVRADRQLVKVFHRGVLVKTHPRQPPGRRSPTPTTCRRTSVYAMRDLDRLAAMAAAHGPAIGAMPQRCSTIRCRGPRCVRSMPCWAWSRSGERSGSRRPAHGRWRPRRSTSG